jgi:hypothetical protein
MCIYMGRQYGIYMYIFVCICIYRYICYVCVAMTRKHFVYIITNCENIQDALRELGLTFALTSAVECVRSSFWLPNRQDPRVTCSSWLCPLDGFAVWVLLSSDQYMSICGSGTCTVWVCLSAVQIVALFDWLVCVSGRCHQCYSVSYCARWW